MASGAFPFFIILLFTIVTALIISYISWQRRKVPGARAFSLLFFAVAWWTAAYTAELFSHSLATNQFWFRVKYFGLILIAPSTLWFVARYMRYKTAIRPRTVGMLFIIPLVTVLALWLPGLQELMLANPGLMTVGPFTVLQLELGPWYWINTGYALILLSVSFLLLFNLYRRAISFQRWQIALLGLAISIPAVAFVLTSTRLVPAQNLDVVVFFLPLANVLVGWGILRYRLLDLAPLNLEFVVQQMQDYLILLDDAQRILGVNKAVESAFGFSLEDCIGQPLTAVFPDWAPAITDNDTDDVITITVQGQTRYFDHRLLPRENGQNSIQALILHDVTRRHEAEQAYRYSEASYRTIFDTTGTATVIIEADKTLAVVNKEFENLSGYSRAEIEGCLKWTEFVHPDELARMSAYHDARRHSPENAPSSYEFIFLNRKREERHILLQANMVPGTKRSVISMLDITWRHENESHLQRQNDELAALARLSAATRDTSHRGDIFYLTMQAIDRAIGIETAVVYAYEPHSEKLTAASVYPRSFELIDWEGSPSLGITGYVARTRCLYMCPDVHEDPLTNLSTAQREVMKDIHGTLTLPLFTPERLIGVMHVGIKEKRPFTPEEIRLIQAMVDIAANAVGRADLVANLEAEIATQTAKIVEEKEISEAILKNVADGVIMVTPDMTIQYANDAFLRMSGRSIQQLRQRQLTALLPANIAPPPWSAAADELAQGRSWEGETTFLGPGRQPFTVRLAITPIHSQGETNRGHVITVLDVSQQKALETARAKFMTNISHELRTPITNIRLHADLLRASPVERHGRYLHVISEQTERLQQMFEDILTLSALDSQAEALDNKIIDLKTLFAVVDAQFEAQAQATDAQLTMPAEVDHLPPICGDFNLIQQAIAEVLENAFHYAPASSNITVSVETAVRRDRPFVAIRIEDEGPGLSLDEHKLITKRFYRGEQANAGNIPGTGLGLSIVEAILAQHKGRLLIESQLNRGSAFTLELPAAAVPAPSV